MLPAGSVVGTDAAQTLQGTAGNDLIFGLGGNDALNGGTGNDVMNGGDGNDSLNGGAGNDTLLGGAGDDLLVALGGDDALFGGAGADRLEGGTGADVMRGGAGNDWYLVDNLGDKVIEQAIDGSDEGGVDIVQSGVSFALGAFVENLSLVGTADIDATGNELNNVIGGNTGANVLTGNAGNDLLIGFSGNDTLFGGDGSDNLQGGTGNDVLTGGAGADIMSGGPGADKFVFNAVAESSPNAPDVISDFVHGSDLIDLSAIDAATGGGINSGDQAFSFGGHSANVIAHGVTWFESNGNTVIQADINDNATADFAIVLRGINLQLTQQDFIL